MQKHISLRRSADEPTLYYAVTAVNRYGKESAPITSNSTFSPLTSSFSSLNSTLLTNDGNALHIPHFNEIIQADYFAIYSMQGNIINTKPFAADIYISEIPNGVYELRTLNKKGDTHRVAFFVVKREKSL
jgi:hypothetical protein